MVLCLSTVDTATTLLFCHFPIPPVLARQLLAWRLRTAKHSRWPVAPSHDVYSVDSVSKGVPPDVCDDDDTTSPLFWLGSRRAPVKIICIYHSLMCRVSTSFYEDGKQTNASTLTGASLDNARGRGGRQNLSWWKQIDSMAKSGAMSFRLSRLVAFACHDSRFAK